MSQEEQDEIIRAESFKFGQEEALNRINNLLKGLIATPNQGAFVLVINEGQLQAVKVDQDALLEGKIVTLTSK